MFFSVYAVAGRRWFGNTRFVFTVIFCYVSLGADTPETHIPFNARLAAVCVRYTLRTSFAQVLEESTTATVERVLASRPHLRDEAEAEAAREAQAVAAESIGDGRSELEVPSLEELVAEKAEELRTRPQDRSQEETTRSSPVREDLDRNATPLIGVRPTVEFGWPWPTDWLSAPRVPIGDVEIHDAHVDSGGFAVGHGDVEADDGDRKDTPPFAIEVAAVEVADVEDPDDAHIEVRVYADVAHGYLAFWE